MRLNFKTDYSQRLHKGWTHKTVTVGEKTFRLIARYQDGPKCSREYTLKGPSVALHADSGHLRWAEGFTVWDGEQQRTYKAGLVHDEVSLGRGMAIHTAEAKAKKIIRKVLAD